VENTKKSPDKLIITGNPGIEIAKNLEVQAFSKKRRGVAITVAGTPQTRRDRL
jgi:hypothetical protein